MKTVIMAGGKGTRIASVNADVPKPMIEIAGKPVLEHTIECLRSQGFDDVIITVSHMADVIMNHFGDGKNFGVKIEYYVEDKPLGNAGALFRLRNKLGERFLLLNADVIFDVDLNRFAEYHADKHALATLFTHPNSHPYDSGIIIADKNNSVTQWLTKEDTRPQWYRNRVNAGIHIIESYALDDVDTEGHEKIDLDRQILKPLCRSGRVFCYDSPEYVKDMGTPERYTQVQNDFISGRVHARNLTHKQKAVFLDRDGTINKLVGFLRNIDEFELLPNVPEAIRRINSSGYLAIVVTNQPVIARGEVSVSELEEIHNKMETLLGHEGAYLDAIYYCPHHPHKGYAGEIPELKIECDCRKPKPGMLLQAANDFNIDLSQSWMIGDSENDILAGKSAGCKTGLIGSDYDSLYDFVLKEIAS
ncbi:MAG: HAD-IIIA family hydrolase [Synergistaceae bacterium]|nr:HAD-IIIA family hydrolase [Synergistaceae bacterium]MBQ3450169.1 HAD-IIIA family hydrolase [Synergistaceae bacterium]MBR0251298.1 HAD-IIIA family hydrolase [Synergistaceae bacterium]